MSATSTDGAQQQLVALTIKARLAEQMVDRDPAKARDLVAQIGAETTDALETLRDLARGVYPPLLADKGLVAALEHDRRREGLRVCRAAWLLGVTVREYRELESGERDPDVDTWERMCEVFGWPRQFEGRRGTP